MIGNFQTYWMACIIVSAIVMHSLYLSCYAGYNYVQILFFDTTWIYDIVVRVQIVCSEYARSVGLQIRMSKLKNIYLKKIELGIFTKNSETLPNLP